MQLKWSPDTRGMSPTDIRRTAAYFSYFFLERVCKMTLSTSRRSVNLIYDHTKINCIWRIGINE